MNGYYFCIICNRFFSIDSIRFWFFHNPKHIVNYYNISQQIEPKDSPEIRQAVRRLMDNVSDKQAEINNDIIEYIDNKNKELINFIDSHDDSFFTSEHICITCGQKVPSDL